MAARRLEPDDQASGLRRLLGEQGLCRPLGIIGPDPLLNAIAASGLSHALAARGADTCILDEAPSPLNAASVLGLTPQYALADLLRSDLRFDDILVEVANNARLMRADRGLALAGATEDRRWNRLAEDFARIAGEWLILAAPSDERPNMALAAPRRLLVLPTGKSRLAEAYAVLKTAHRLQPDAVWSALFMNTPDESRAEQLMAALDDTARRFLGIDIQPLGTVPADDKLDRAIRAMRPVQEIDASAPSAMAFRQLAELLHHDRADAMDARTFWQRLGLFGRLNRPPRSTPARATQHDRAFG